LKLKRIFQTIAAPMCLTMVLLAAPSPPAQQDYFHAQGGRIVDSRGRTVHLAGVSWWGLETDHFAPLGLDRRPMDDVLAEIRAMGFNTLRIPYCNQMLHGGLMPQGISMDWNPELKGLTPLQVMDHMITGARQHGLRVILDRHRPDAHDQSDLWYTKDHSEAEWIADWKMLAARYRNDDTVIGFDLHNEPHGIATWGTGEGAGDKATDWRLAAERAGNAVLSVNPHLLILVEGVATVDGDTYWWGGNLSAAGKYPVRLSRPAQLVYAPHDYPPSVAQQAWFKAVDYPANLPQVWKQHWGYLAEQGRVPVVMGEFGTNFASAGDKQWMAQLVTYLAGHKMSALYWSLNPESTVDQNKLAALEPVLAPHKSIAPVESAASRNSHPKGTETAGLRKPRPQGFVLDLEPKHPYAGSGSN
jgi:endoglucanase